MLRILSLLLAALTVRATAPTPTQVSGFVENADGSVFFVVDDPRVGRVDATKIELVTPDYAEFAYRDASLNKMSSTSSEARCAYVGVAEGENVVGVSLFSCGLRGPLIQITFEDATVTELTRVGGASSTDSLDGAYESRIWFTDVRKANFTAAGETKGPLELLDQDALSSASRRKARSLLQTGPAKVLYFDYVFVSDNKRYLNYGGDTSAVLADTIAELLYVNQIYLVGNRFDPQIQFRIKQQYVWEQFPSQISSSNVGSGSIDGFGNPQIKMSGDQLLKEFQLWIFETIYFNFTGYLASGDAGSRGNFTTFLVNTATPEYALGDDAHGWHILTGEPVVTYSSEGAVMGLANIGTICKAVGHADWRNGCEVLFDYLDNPSNAFTLDWETIHDGMTSDSYRCFASNNIGFTSTVNTPQHDFPGLILAHELGHNLGFKHVYNAGDSSGDVSGCMAGDFAHNGSAILGYSQTDGHVSWSQCSVNKFNEKLTGLTQLSVAGDYGMYSCADTGEAALPASTFVGIPFAEGQPGYMHHVPSPPSGSPSSTPSSNPSPPPGSPGTPGTPANPSPPPLTSPPPSPGAPPIPTGHTAIVFKVSTGSLTLEDKNKIKNAIKGQSNVHSVTDA